MPRNLPIGKMMQGGFDWGYILSGRRKEEIKHIHPTHVQVKGVDGNVRKIPLPPKKGLSWREVLELVLDVLHTHSKTLPGASVSAIVDAIMAWQAAGASVTKSTVEAQLKSVK